MTYLSAYCPLITASVSIAFITYSQQERDSICLAPARSYPIVMDVWPAHGWVTGGVGESPDTRLGRQLGYMAKNMNLGVRKL